MKEEHGQQTRELQIPSMYYRYNENITLKILLFFTLSLVHEYRHTLFVIDSQSEENGLKSGVGGAKTVWFNKKKKEISLCS